MPVSVPRDRLRSTRWGAATGTPFISALPYVGTPSGPHRSRVTRSQRASLWTLSTRRCPGTALRRRNVASTSRTRTTALPMTGACATLSPASARTWRMYEPGVGRLRRRCFEDDAATRAGTPRADRGEQGPVTGEGAAGVADAGGEHQSRRSPGEPRRAERNESGDAGE